MIHTSKTNHTYIVTTYMLTYVHIYTQRQLVNYIHTLNLGQAL